MGTIFPKLSKKSHTTKYEGDLSGSAGQQTHAMSAMKEFSRRHTGEVNSVASFSESNICLSGGTDKIVVAFDVTSGNDVCKWSGHTSQIVKLCASSKDQPCFSSSRDKTIRCWRLSNASMPIQTLTGHTLVAPALSYSKVSQRLFSGSRDNSVRLWDVASGSCVASKDMPRNIVTAVQWLGNGTMVAQTGEDKVLKIWDTRTMEVAISFPMKQYFQTCCDVSLDDLQVMTGSTGFNGNGSEIIIWDVRQCSALAELRGHQSRITGCRFIPSSSDSSPSQSYGLIGSVACDSTLRIWDQQRKSCIANVAVDGAMELTGMTLLANQSVAVSTIDRGVCIYDLKHPSYPCLVATF